MTSHTDIFVRYYIESFWANRDGSSGPNSAVHLTPLLRQRLSDLLERYSIQSLVDAGCGDANLIRHMDLKKIHYKGLDCVPQMIEKNRSLVQRSDTMQFEIKDILHDPIPRGDLILCRDVVHYLPNYLIWTLLHNLQQSGSTYLLITHNLYAPKSANTPTTIGIFRPVNLTQDPFHFISPLEVLMEDEYGKALGLWDLQSLPVI